MKEPLLRTWQELFSQAGWPLFFPAAAGPSEPSLVMTWQLESYEPAYFDPPELLLFQDPELESSTSLAQGIFPDAGEGIYPEPAALA